MVCQYYSTFYKEPLFGLNQLKIKIFTFMNTSYLKNKHIIEKLLMT